ncbi:MAG: hypothetical protein KAW41_01155 [Candidatus Diapherotrites archaeon]|nr:hypothetical protein [Candidatus Diapherotrites archaeon]
MHPMKEFVVSVTDRIGAMRDVFRAIAGADINIKAVSTEVCGKEGQIRIITDDPDKTVEVLEKEGFKFAENEVITASLEDKPGQLLECTEKLANKNVNIRAAYTIGREGDKIVVGFVVDNVAEAKKICYPGLTHP